MSKRATPDLWDHLNAYLRRMNLAGSTASTLKHKKKEIRLFLRYLEGQGHSMRVEDVTADDIEHHLEEMTSRGLAEASAETRHRALHAWWEWMVRKGIARSNPAAAATKPRSPEPRKPFLAEGAFNKLLGLCDPETLPGSRRIAMLLVLVTTGIRRFELRQLELADVDWERGRILIRNGKGRKARAIPLLDRPREALKLYLAHRKDLEAALWVTEKGKPFQYNGIGKDVTRLFQRAEVEVVDSIHVFRRTFAREAVLRHIPRPYIRQVAGWSTDHMLNQYTRAMEDEDEALDYFHSCFDPFPEE